MHSATVHDHVASVYVGYCTVHDQKIIMWECTHASSRARCLPIFICPSVIMVQSPFTPSLLQYNMGLWATCRVRNRGYWKELYWKQQVGEKQDTNNNMIHQKMFEDGKMVHWSRPTCVPLKGRGADRRAGTSTLFVPRRHGRMVLLPHTHVLLLFWNSDGCSSLRHCFAIFVSLKPCLTFFAGTKCKPKLEMNKHQSFLAKQDGSLSRTSIKHWLIN
jgi:hypothetical protein